MTLDPRNPGFPGVFALAHAGSLFDTRTPLVSSAWEQARCVTSCSAAAGASMICVSLLGTATNDRGPPIGMGDRKAGRVAGLTVQGSLGPSHPIRNDSWGASVSGEIRQNKATKEWVIFAPVRGQRPHDHRPTGRTRSPSPPHEPTCPFCPGNEHLLTSILAEWPRRGHDHWQARVVPNQYPVLTPQGSTARSIEGPYMTMQGYGHHEVIIESPRHDDDIATMSSADVLTLIEAYHQRFVHLHRTIGSCSSSSSATTGPRRRLAHPSALAVDHDRHGPAQRTLEGARAPAPLR